MAQSMNANGEILLSSTAWNAAFLSRLRLFARPVPHKLREGRPDEEVECSGYIGTYGCY